MSEKEQELLEKTPANLGEETSRIHPLDGSRRGGRSLRGRVGPGMVRKASLGERRGLDGIRNGVQKRCYSIFVAKELGTDVWVHLSRGDGRLGAVMR